MTKSQDTESFLDRLLVLQIAWRTSLERRGHIDTHERQALREHMAIAPDEALVILAQYDAEAAGDKEGVFDSSLEKLHAVREACVAEVRERAARRGSDDLIEID